MAEYIRSSVFPPPVIAAFSLRTGGVSGGDFGLNLSYRVGDDPSNVARNRARLFGSLGIAFDRTVTLNQVHGSRLVVVSEPGEIDGADGLVTDQRGLFLCVTVADCVPLLMFDPVRHVVAAVHAGWRGTGANIAPSAVKVMEDRFGSRPADILVHIGPAAASCCYEVGADVAERFADQFVAQRGSRTFLDVKSANRQQLLDCGLAPGNVQSSLFCTISDSTLFHSHRRDGKRSGRMMGVIGLTA